MLVVPSLESFQIHLSQLPIDGVSYSLIYVADGIVVNLGDAAVQQVSVDVHTFILTVHGVGYSLFICLHTYMCRHCFVHMLVHTYCMYVCMLYTYAH